jgi:AraC family transcriptional regulator
MHPRIETLPEKKLVGKWLEMSFANNKTAELWRSFMPRKKEIFNTASTFFDAALRQRLRF